MPSSSPIPLLRLSTPLANMVKPKRVPFSCPGNLETGQFSEFWFHFGPILGTLNRRGRPPKKPREVATYYIYIYICIYIYIYIYIHTHTVCDLIVAFVDVLDISYIVLYLCVFIMVN